MEPLEPRLALDASALRITELVASNDNGLLDTDGDASDWLEIFNSGNNVVDLSGMYLTDSPNNLRRWRIPVSVTMEPGTYLIVFASNKNGVREGELHTNFALSADGEFLALVDTNGTTILDQYAPEFPEQFKDISYGRAMVTTGAARPLVSTGAVAKAIVPTSDSLSTAWREADFDDSGWPIAGPTGLGYENSSTDPINFASQIQTPLPSGTSSAYIRITFNLESLADIGRLTLRMKFDDGFAAYINGVPIVEANVPETLQWDSAAAASRADSAAVIFENFDVSAAVPALRIGKNVLAIHALNEPEGSDMLVVPELFSRTSAITAPEKLGYFSIPTPGYGNTNNVFGYINEPTFSLPHGFYSSLQHVAITTATPGATIVYTTDGSTPEVTSSLNVVNGMLYTEPIELSGTTILRARAFKIGYEPSFVEASSYIFVDDVINQSPFGQVPPGFPANGVNGQQLNYGIDPEIIALYGDQAVKDSLLSLSTISITLDSAALFDLATGIYVNAPNRGRSWERLANVELINPDGSQGFEVNAGLRIRGGAGRDGHNPKHAFRLYFRSDYGDSKLEYPLFGDEGADEFDVLDLRTERNYSWSSDGNVQNTFVREVFGRDTQSALGSEYTRSRYHHLYINGVYWGIYMTQERVEEFFAETYFGGSADDYDIVKADVFDLGRTEVSEGNDAAWRQLFDYGQALATNPVANANVYWTMQGLNPDGTRNHDLPVLLDAENLVNFMLVIFYTGGYDTGLSRFFNDNVANNWFGLYNRVAADEGFQFFIHDNEHSMGADYSALHGTQLINRIGPFNNGNQNNFEQFNPQYLHQDLMLSSEYRQLFIDQVQRLFFNGGALTVEESLARFLGRVAEVEPAVIAEAARWGDSKTSPALNKSHWQAEIDWIVNTYLPMRSDWVLNQLRAAGIYTTFAAPTFSQFGGTVPYNFPLSITVSTGIVYFSTDGITDPRLIDGEVNPAASVYTGALTLTGDVTVKARLRTSSGAWSGLVEATFNVQGLPGDFDNDGDVDGRDFLTWQRGGSPAPLSSADLASWQNNYGASYAENFPFDFVDQTYEQNFDSFQGTEGTLPPHFSITIDSGADIYRGEFHSNTNAPSDFTGVMAATSDGENYSLAWRESTGGANVSDARVWFTFTNNTGVPITGFDVNYDVETWVNGRRDNQIRFKYDIYTSNSEAQAAEGRNAFETDIFATVNPNYTPIAANGDQFNLDGKNVANRETVSGYVDLLTLLVDENDPSKGVFGELALGQTAYFRWQKSNAALTDGNRSALGIDNISITARAEAPVESANFEGDGIVDGHDFLAWQRIPSIGDVADWESQFGPPEPIVAAVTSTFYFRGNTSTAAIPQSIAPGADASSSPIPHSAGNVWIALKDNQVDGESTLGDAPQTSATGNFDEVFDLWEAALEQGIAELDDFPELADEAVLFDDGDVIGLAWAEVGGLGSLL